MSNTAKVNLFERLYLPAWVPAAVILVLALLIRLIGLGAESAWIDEGYSLALARHSVSEIIRGTAADQHPPLYYLLLHFWLMMGKNVFYARLLSVILGVINVYQVLVFGRQLKGQWLGLGAALLLAVNPMHVWYSQEIRQYMLLVVLTTASTMEFWACLQGKRRWWTYGIFTLLALYTQYFAVFIIFAQVLFGIGWAIWKREKRFLLSWIITLVGVGFLFTSWLPTVINQFLHHTMPWIGEPEAGQIRDVPLRLIFGSGVLVLPDWMRWLGLIGFVCILLWIIWRLYKRQVEKPSVLAFLAIWGIAPYLAISCISFVYPLFQFKQFLILLPPLLMLATAITELFPLWWKYLLYLCLLMIPLFSLIYQQATLSKDDWRGLSAYIEANSQKGDLVYTNPAGASLALDLYLDPLIKVKGYPPDFDILTGGWRGQPLTPENAAQELSALNQISDRLWLVEFFPEFWDKDGLFPAWLADHAELLDDQWFGNIHLRLYQFGQALP